MSFAESDSETTDWLEKSILAAKNGVLSELGKVLNYYRPYLRTIAEEKLFKAVQPKMAPLDLVQETLTKAFQTFGQFQGTTDAELKTWLQKILLGTIVDADRRYTTKKRNVHREVSLAENGNDLGLAVPSQAPSPSSHFRHGEIVQHVRAALQELPADQRQLVLWRNFEKLDFPTIAERLTCSPLEAGRRWAIAVEALAIVLKRYGYNSD